MAQLPKPLQDVIDAFERLPGIGAKTAQRLGFYLVRVPEHELEKFAQALTNLKHNTVTCQQCFNIATANPCAICADPSRVQTVLLVIEQPIDIINFESTGRYQGQYHVLHGRIDPLNNVGPDDIYLAQLLQRITSQRIQEVILATNSDMEGEATAMYISKKAKSQSPDVKITRLAHGLPVGGAVEFADATTLARALEGRREM